MKDLVYYSENAVYLDNIASRNGGKVGAYSTTGATFDAKTDSITTSDGSYLSIGAQNEKWFEMWQTALSEAKAPIKTQTPKYFQSNACAEEMGKIREVLKKKRNKLEVLAITVDGTCAAMAIGPQPPRATPMPLNKVPCGPTTRQKNDIVVATTPLQHLKDSWIISESDYQKVAKDS